MNNWFPFIEKKQISCKKIIFCFYHAGGNAGIFKDWLSARRGFDVIPVELPGRGGNQEVPYISDFNYLTRCISIAIHNLVQDQELYIFGHSMGAAVGFEVIKGLRERYGREVKKLIVAGRHAPGMRDPSSYHSSMGQEALHRELKRLKKTPASLLENREFLSLVLPVIYSDYQLHESYVYNGQPIDVPIAAHAGKDDTEAGRQLMQEWRKTTSASFALKVFPGEHFFPYSHPNYLDYLTEEINA